MDEQAKFPYEFQKFIGKGAYGEVYLVEEKKSSQRKFALKKIPKMKINNSESQQKNLYSEISVMQQLIQLKNPNVINLDQVLQSKDHYYIIMEYCKDGDLEIHMKQNQTTCEEDAVEILRQLMNGFKALHEISVVHRDIKPQNIFINNGVFKLGDFGFSRQSGIEGIVEASSIYGTPAFMAPELLSQSISSYTSKVDIWSLGVLIFYVMFRKYPFDLTQKKKLVPIFMFKVEGNYPNLDFKSALHQLEDYLSEQIKISRISEEFKDLFIKMLQPHPLDRISFIELYKHPLFDKEDVLQTISKSCIPKTSQFKKQKLEAEKLYPQIEQKEKINQLDQNLETLKEKYLQYKNISLFLQFICVELIAASTKVKELFSNSAIYSIISYLYLKIYQITESLDSKQNVFDSPIFSTFVDSIHYEAVQKSYKEDLAEIERIRKIIGEKVEKKFISQDFIRINSMKDPSEFVEAFTIKMIQFSQQIKDNYVNNKLDVDATIPESKAIRLQALTMAFYVACGGLIDNPEQWNIIAPEAKNQPSVLKYLGAQKKETDLLEDIDKVCQLAGRLLKKKLSSLIIN